MRAAYPEVEGVVERDGVKLSYQVFGRGERTILLLPTWTIIHSRFWKMQVPYLSRHYRVVTYDGPGNGGSDRVTDPERYAPDAYARDAVAVLDACRIERVVAVGLSLGAAYAARLGRQAPDRVTGIVMIGPALPLTPASPRSEMIQRNFTAPYPEDVDGWGKYNLAYWYDHYHDFTRFFFEQCFNEAHSTKPIEDAVGWAAETGPEILEAAAFKPQSSEPWPEALESLSCPVLVIHGTRDLIIPYEVGVEAVRLTNGTLMTMTGSGHIPNARDPVKVNFAIRRFVESVAS